MSKSFRNDLIISVSDAHWQGSQGAKYPDCENYHLIFDNYDYRVDYMTLKNKLQCAFSCVQMTVTFDLWNVECSQSIYADFVVNEREG